MKRPVPLSLLAIGYALFGLLLLMMVIAAVILTVEGRLPGVTHQVFILSDNGRVTPAFLRLRVLVVALSLFNFVVAWGLWKLRNWSREAALFEAAMLCALVLSQVAVDLRALIVREPEPWTVANLELCAPIATLAGMTVAYLLLRSTRQAFQPRS